MYLIGVHLMGGHFMGMHLMGGHFMGMHLMGEHFISRHLMGIRLMGGHLMSRHLKSMHLKGGHLMGRHLMGMHLMGRHLMGMHLMGRHLICIDFELLIFKIVSGKDDLYLTVAFGGPGLAGCGIFQFGQKSVYPTVWTGLGSGITELMLRNLWAWLAESVRDHNRLLKPKVQGFVHGWLIVVRACHQQLLIGATVCTELSPSGRRGSLPHLHESRTNAEERRFD
jgi:hypothetical protein